MNTTPQISIVMPCYQQVDFLEEAVRSVLDQRGIDLELLVMDPGSTDGSRELLQALREEDPDRLQLHFSPDSGQANAINRGMSRARGHVLGWLNSDDRLRPDALQEVVPLLAGPEPRWLYGRCGIIDDRGRQTSPYIVWYKNLRGRRFSIYKLLTEDFIPQMATFWNRPLWETVSGLDETCQLAMDYDLFLRFAGLTHPLVRDTYLADFRVHRQAKSSTETTAHFREAYRIAGRYGAELGWRGRQALLLHKLYALRTRVIYRLIKP